MKLYIVSGLGADFKVLEKLTFNPGIEVCFIPWLIPEPKETFSHYVGRMAEFVDESEPFYLLGYSFGGIIVQEINALKPAQKTVILASIKSNRAESVLMKMGRYSRIPKYLPRRLFSDKSVVMYAFMRKLFDQKNPNLLPYFTVRDPYYLKWSIEKIVEWKRPDDPKIIQIMGDRDIVFPIKRSNPDYVVKNGTHLFPATKHKEVSKILSKIFV